ncbi:MAG TPA: hypothetical protein VHL80_02150 [Polyangia bacterium]|nr:hypothetical protein [Polyangia bacterium]
MATAAPSSPPPRRPLGARFWAFITFLLALGAAGLAVFTYSLYIHDRIERDELGKRVAAWDGKFDAFKSAVRDIDRHLSSVVYQEIDLPGSGWQPIAGGFYVIDLAVVPQAKGVKVLGKVINPTTVTHEQAQLSIKIGEHKATFVLPHVPPGVAQPFEVAVPDVPPADAKRAYLALDSSTISFSSSTTRKGPDKGPVDTDKLLK